MTTQAIRVLLVDDEESIRAPLAHHLEKHHRYIVDTAANGNEALQLLQDSGYDVIIIDQVLEGDISGKELLKEIKKEYPGIPLIATTGWGMTEEAVDILRMGAYRYLAKPFNVDELALTIQFAAEEGRTRLEGKYMAALVKVSQGLTQTTRQDEQLALVWNFVREQLDVSTFFVGLNTSDKKKIHFPLAYDDAQSIKLPDIVLGKIRTEWGLAGYVIRTGHELIWSTLDEEKKISQTKGIAPYIIKGRHPASCICIPLRIGERILGVIAAQSYQANAITPVLQNALRSLSGQISVALDNSRLFAETEQRAIDIEYQANRLSALQQLTLILNSSLDLKEILTKTCQAAVNLFQADHSSLVLFDPDYLHGRVVAEYPEMGMRGMPLRGIPAEEHLVENLTPIIINDVRSENTLGEIREILSDLNIKSTMIVPVTRIGRALGSFSLDAIGQKRKFTQEEINLCKTFADHVAVAIENASLFQQIHEREQLLAALDEASRHIRAEKETSKLLHEIVRLAAQLVDCSAGGLCLNRPHLQELEIIVTYGHPLDLVGYRLKHAEGFLGHVAHTGEAMIINDYATWSNHEHIFESQGIKAIVGIPLKQTGKLRLFCG